MTDISAIWENETDSKVESGHKGLDKLLSPVCRACIHTSRFFMYVLKISPISVRRLECFCWYVKSANIQKHLKFDLKPRVFGYYQPVLF